MYLIKSFISIFFLIKMKWNVVAPFFKENTSDARWLDDFVPNNKHSFTKIPYYTKDRKSWHHRSSKNTALEEWKNFWVQSKKAAQSNDGGIITVFPQLAITSGLQQRLFHQSTPIVAWCFNIGTLYSGIKQTMSKFALHDVSRFIVHSRQEINTVSSWLDLPQERFQFVHLQSAPIAITEQEEKENPFILSMGAANRDYKTFLKAVEKLKIRTIIVARHDSLQNLTIPSNVEILSGLSRIECHRLAQKALINVVPLLDTPTASGQVTVVEAMQMIRPVIATKCVGSEDYIQDGKTGLLVKPCVVEELTEAIDKLWSDTTYRNQIAKAAGQYAIDNFSDEVAGTKLGQILDEVATEKS
jgi:glycosyltransferase involved in cell wall biosynthesis